MRKLFTANWLSIHWPVAAVPSWNRAQAAALAVVVAVSLILGSAIRLPQLGTGEDEAVYLLLSESLERGEYRDSHIPGAPLHAKYPPGTAAWIAVVRAVAGPDPDAVRLGNLLLIALAGVLLADGWRRLGNAWLGIGTAAILLWNPITLRVSTTLSSEPLYIVFSVAAVWATLLGNTLAATTLRARMLAAGMAVAGFLTRTAGLGLLVGIGCWALATRRWRFVVGYALTSLTVVLGWLGYLRFAMGKTVAQTYAVDLAGRAQSGMTSTVEAAFAYQARFLPAVLQLPTIPGTPVDNAGYLLVFTALSAVGLVAIFRRWPAAGMTLLASAAVIALWGWPTERLIIPLLPWIASTFLAGAWLVGMRISERSRLLLPLGMALSLMTLALQSSARGANAAAVCRRVDQYQTRECTSIGQRALMEAATTLADSIPPGVVLATVKPSTVHYFSRQLVVPVSSIASEAELGALIEGTANRAGVTHLLLTPYSQLELRRIAGILTAHCHQVDIVRRFPLGALLIDLRGHNPADDACVALAEFAESFPPPPDLD